MWWLSNRKTHPTKRAADWLISTLQIMVAGAIRQPLTQTVSQPLAGGKVSMNYRKLPFWGRSEFYKFRKLWCLIGLHIPVRCDNPDGTFEVFCQECAKPMSIEQWQKFFAKAQAG